MSKLLTPEQKETRLSICVDILENIENDPKFLENVITCDESWFFQYDPETKRQSMNWKSPSSPMRQKKARLSKSKFELMMIVFFYIRGIVHIEWVPEGRTVNQVYYQEILITCRERVRRRRRVKCGKTAHGFFTRTTRQHIFFLAKKIPVLEHPPYSADLAPCDFFLIPKIKSGLKRTRFESVDAVKNKPTQVIYDLSEKDLQHCFQQWMIRMKRCRDQEGDCFQGNNISIE